MTPPYSSGRLLVCLLLFGVLAVPGHAQKARIPSPPSAKKAKAASNNKSKPAAAKSSRKKGVKKGGTGVRKKVVEPGIVFPRPSVVIPRPIRKRRRRAVKKTPAPSVVIPGPRKNRPEVAEPEVIRVYLKKGKKVVKKRIEPFQGVRDFPELQFNAFLNMLERRAKEAAKRRKDEAVHREKEERAFRRYLRKLKGPEEREAARARALAAAESKTAARIRTRAGELHRLNEELTTILPPGKYRFTRECGLELQPDPRAGNYLNLLCLKSKIRARHSIRNFRDAEANAWLDFPALRVKRELLGVVELREAELHASGDLRWKWKGVEFRYADPFLHVLRREYPNRPEAILLNEKSVSRVIHRLLRLAVEMESSGDDWRKGLDRVLRPGMKIKFAEACPLVVRQRPRREPGVGRVRLRLELSCISGHSLSRVELLMPGKFGHRELWFQEPGRLQASLQYARIFKGGDQFYMVWDTINQIRGLDEKNVDEKK